MLSEYRQRFRQYHARLSLEDYLFRTGARTSSEKRHIEVEYTDLFGAGAVEGLREALNGTAGFLETERKGIGRLIGFAIEGRVLAGAGEVSGEIDEYLGRAAVEWEGRRLGVAGLWRQIRAEGVSLKRRELEARRAGLIEGALDLYADRSRRLRDSIAGLGLADCVAMRRELRGIEIEPVAARAVRILEATERDYDAALSEFLPRLVGVGREEATSADLAFLRAAGDYDAFMPGEGVRRALDDIFRGLGFRLERQANFKIDARVDGAPEPLFAAIEVPGDVRVRFEPRAGQESYRRILRTFGRAQQYAWTSANMQPELCLPAAWSDQATNLAWGMFFESLMGERQWLLGSLGFAESTEFLRLINLLRLMTVRRDAALAIFEIEFHTGSAGGDPGGRYSELMRDALRARFSPAEYVLEMSDCCAASDRMRAAGFEAQFRDRIKTSHCSRWWASARAGEEILDIWNTGLKYGVEELSSKLGMGGIDFDYLIDDLRNGI